MAELIQAVVLISALFLLLSCGLWISITLIACGLLAIVTFTDSPAGLIFTTTTWSSMASWSLTALPLFIWMGEILHRSRIAEDMFRGLSPWLGWLPGRLLHVNVAACGIFAAVSGSSAATAATIGKISLPELKSRHYDEAMSIGSLAGAGTLGLLIPPSIIMIVYGVAAQVSIGRLFSAGILPGVLVMGLFSSYIIFWALRHPDRALITIEDMPWRERLIRLRLFLPVISLIFAVIGSIYVGIATATEAAACGVVGALFIAFLGGSLTWRSFVDSLLGATRTSCMICFILLGAAYLTSAMSFTGLPSDLASWITSMNLSRYQLIAALTILFVVLGCFLDGISTIVLTTSVILPAVQAVGIDLIWFGIYLVIVIETAQITPPVGINLFVIQGLTEKNILSIARMALPFFILMVIATVLVTLFPQIVLFLPQQM